ncbi:hypothetical protein ACSLBF_11385 [Pseudoalteromonas sp. T1lg65]|uniref:hypothetical protein n=1 Tax=Pseudoalteromonas sp. T1lg65 TaxID=2077101 RepID=UPI003F7B200B
MKNLALLLLIALTAGCVTTSTEPVDIKEVEFEDKSNARRLLESISLFSVQDTEVPKDSLVEYNHGLNVALSALEKNATLGSVGWAGLTGMLLNPEDRASRMFIMGLTAIDKNQTLLTKDLVTLFDEEILRFHAALYDIPVDQISVIEPKQYNELNAYQTRKFLVTNDEFCQNRLDKVIAGRTVKGPGILDKRTAEERYQLMKNEYDGLYQNEVPVLGGCVIPVSVSAYYTTRISGENFPWLDNSKDYVSVEIPFIFNSKLALEAIRDSKVQDLYLFIPAGKFSVGYHFEKQETNPYPSFNSNHGAFMFVKEES